ncbi:MAG: potassium transporter TrkG [Caldilineaceae bacterium]
MVLVLSLNVALVATWLLLATHPFTLDTALFEVMSALSTCGLSLGITGQLNVFGHLLIMAVMFWGG